MTQRTCYEPTVDTETAPAAAAAAAVVDTAVSFTTSLRRTAACYNTPPATAARVARISNPSCHHRRHHGNQFCGKK